MHSRLEDAKQHVIEKATEVARSRRGGPGPDLDKIRQLLATYYLHAVPEDLVDRTPVDVLGAAMSHFRLAAVRPQGKAIVRVFTPSVDGNEWSADGHSVVEIVTDDMPFLVDSVTMALNDEDRALHLVIHPQLLARRDLTGQLLELCDADEAESPQGPDVLRESWMHIEIDRVSGQESLDAIEKSLSRVLRDVREVVEDWQKMHAQAREIVSDITSADLPLPDTEVGEAKALLEWLADDHFTFLGYREYQLQRDGDDDLLRAIPGTGLGILRSDQDMSATFGKLPPAVKKKAREKTLLIITKANSRSTVHRPVYLDYVGIKTFDSAGDVMGERRFLGLFSSAAYTESLMRIPVLRDKAGQVLRKSGYSPLSHSGKALLDILETYPRDELFQTSVDELLPVAEAVLHLRERRQLRLFVRRDTYGRYLSCLVYLPRDRYTTQVRERMQQILKQTMGADTLDYTARVSESVLARLHFVIRAAPGDSLNDFDEGALEERLAEATRSWADDFAVAVTEQFGEESGAKLAREYAHAFPEAYKEDFSPRMAAGDVRRLEDLGDSSLSLSLYQPVDAGEGEARFKVFRKDTPLSLSQVLPVLSALGVEVIDERPYEVERLSGRAWTYDFGLRRGAALPEGARELFQDGFMAVWSGRAESDGFSALVLDGAIPWRQVTILRAYAKYLRQGGSPFSQSYIESSVLANVPIARLLVQLFDARFDPGSPERSADSKERLERVGALESEIERALDAVESLDQDRIMRSYLMAIKATLRTNFYQPDADGNPKTYLALKLEPKLVPDLPAPRPQFEIFVHSARVEGVHLRFGAVARGGLRWSDRREDFRTEILGLVKAQMVKNTVIVPVGAKGGFYCKQLPNPAVDREAWLAEGVACYKTFISGLLDITDNLVGGDTVPPSRVVRHDGDDSYLVVAADKGTATFSDIANGVARDYGFWLGDAFASGGSVGYDHKAMGITARGAWESVRRHFRERGIDCQSEDFTAVGVGDMSGDVFGNGMLLSEHTKLLAAFDHRDIFLDPSPDSASSFAERRRLFELPRSTWSDYDSSLISEGGGVFSRTLKSIEISSAVSKALGLEGDVKKLAPQELMRAILLAPVDLLWNGGIGTYVKASTESQADAGDKANDNIRVDGGELRVRAVGEGGNLGLTQRGRIEYARAGGRINTDFIDNSAGVDTSDHEVNIKILLDRVVLSGDMTQKQRNTLLASMTDEVGRLVLADNYAQNIALANSEAVAKPLMHVHESWIRRLERRGLIDREIEFLPSEREFRNRRTAGTSLTAPELSVLLAYTKIVLESELLDTDLADDPFLSGNLFDYFPAEMREAHRSAIQEHPLRREIIVTQVVNSIVNFGGITFFHRLSQETNASAAELARAQLVSRELYGADDLVRRISALDHVVGADVQTDMRLSVRTLIERATRWLVNHRRSGLDSEETIAHFAPAIGKVVRSLPEVLVGVQRAEFESRRKYLESQAVPDDLANDVAVLSFAYPLLEMAEAGSRGGADALQFAKLHAKLSERLRLSEFAAKIDSLPRNDRWQTMARASLRDDFYAVHAALTEQVLDGSTDPDEQIATWEATDDVAIHRATATFEDILSEDETDLAHLSVGLRVIRTLLSTQ